jgi:aminoglycoside phosphotransferase (APT) family kinase protein
VKGNIEAVVRQFQIEGEFLDARPYGTGHLHDTLLVNMIDNQRHVPYIFQRINHFAFRNPSVLMENIVRVTGFIRQKLEAQHLTKNDISRRVLTVILTRDGEAFYRDAGGNYWRAYIFIKGAQTYDKLDSLDQAYQVAYMFGQFLVLLQDFPDPPLQESIPGFHNGPKRFRDFQEALAADPQNRAITAKAEIDFLLDRAPMFDVIPDLVQRNKIPIRVTHNDPKVNNVMLDDVTGKGVCVIDLDTVMNGVSLFDFGDLARSGLSSAAEDERDLSKVSIEIPRFEAILKGFLAGVGESLTQTEQDYLVFSSKLMTLLIGMRFLTDYLQGDVYFKVHRQGHNLDRCRRQFKLVQLIIHHEDEMNALCLRRPGGSF